MHKMLNIREEQSQGGTKLAADISTAHSSMLEILMTKKKGLIKNRTAFYFKKESLLSEMPLMVIKLALSIYSISFLK